MPEDNKTMFDNNASVPVTPNPETPTEINSYQDHLVGDGKKFQTTEDLAKGKFESDQYIERLLREQEELRTDLNTRLTLEELLAKREAEQASNPPGTPPEGERTPIDDVNHGASNLDPNEIANLVKQSLTQEQQQNARASNMAQAAEALKERWGPNYVETLRQRGRELGMTEDALDNLASESPRAFTSLVLGERKKVQDGSAPVSSVSVTTTNASTVPGRDMKYFKELRKTDPRTYWSSRVQNEMHTLAQAGKLDV